MSGAGEQPSDEIDRVLAIVLEGSDPNPEVNLPEEFYLTYARQIRADLATAGFQIVPSHNHHAGR